MTPLEPIVTPFVKQRVFVTTAEELALANSLRLIFEPSLVSALRVGLQHGRRFMLRPGPKDW